MEVRPHRRLRSRHRRWGAGGRGEVAGGTGDIVFAVGASRCVRVRGDTGRGLERTSRLMEPGSIPLESNHTLESVGHYFEKPWKIMERKLSHFFLK